MGQYAPYNRKNRVWLKNLSNQEIGSLYEAFPAEQAHDLARRLGFHYTPKHGSWLNIAEIELAVLSNMCLTQRIPDKDHLRREIEANVNARNAKACSRQLALHLSGYSPQTGTFVSSFFKLTD